MIRMRDYSKFPARFEPSQVNKFRLLLTTEFINLFINDPIHLFIIKQVTSKRRVWMKQRKTFGMKNAKHESETQN